ncbi:MAG: hypothetical protein ACYDBW_05770 [Sulfuricaulis sp.]
MNTIPPPGDLVQNKNGGIKQGIGWIALGMRTVLEQKSLWFGMTAVYFVFGFLLKLIPFMGDLLLILITPMLLAGVVWGRAPENQSGQGVGVASASAGASVFFQVWITQPAQELLRIFAQQDKVFGAVLLGIITLGLAMLVDITGYLLIGGSMVSGLAASPMSAPQPGAVLGMLVLAAMYVVLGMGLFYSVPLTVLGNRQPLATLADSFTACFKNAAALVTLSIPFLVVYLVILAAFAEYRWLGYLLVVSAGFVLLPVFIASALSSYQSLFPAVPPASRR